MTENGGSAFITKTVELQKTESDLLVHIEEQQREITRLREALKKVGARIENLGYDDYTDIQSIISAAIQETSDD